MSDEWISLVTRKESVLWVSLVCAGGAREYFQRALSWDVAIQRYRYANDTHQISLKDALELRHLIDTASSEEFYSFYERRCEAAIRTLYSVTDEIAIAESARSGEYGGHLQRYFEVAKETMPFLASMVLVESALEAELRRQLSKHLKCDQHDKAVAEVLRDGVFMEKETSLVNEVHSLLEIVELADSASGRRAISELTQGNGSGPLASKLLSLIDDHLSRFGWQQTFAYLHDPASTEQVLNRIHNYLVAGKGYPSVSTLVTRRAARKEKAQAKRQELALPEPISRLLNIAGRLQSLRFRRVDCHFESEVRIRHVFQHAASTLDISREDLVHLTETELLVSLRQGSPVVTQEEILRRRSAFCMTVEGPNIETVAEEREQDKYNAFDFDEELAFPLRGTTAFEGFVRGNACLVGGPVDVSKVSGGNGVLVTPMTTPDLMIGIEKAAAIVTDEGGLLCHAAIISRELQVPCVIGTKYATRALKDGQACTVDARRAVGLVMPQKVNC